MGALPESIARALAGVHLFGVRHHSPRTSDVLRRHLDALEPALVLVEGPADAGPCLDVLLDPTTTPPVAILGYRTDGVVGSTLFPLASYSPEYVALRWAKDHGVPARFIDITIGQGLACERDPPEPAASDEPADAAEVDSFDLHGELAHRFGHRSFEEFWEAAFEAPVYEPAAFRDALLGYADVLRALPDPRADYHRARDLVMAERIAEAVRTGVAPERIAVVVGAAHAAALAAGDVDPALGEYFAETVETAVTLIPYSFPRLAEQTGYGAGNRAPRYYQRAFDNGCDFRRATLEALIEFSQHLRLRGFMVSLADTIEAFRLATMLAQIRSKSAPGLDEVRESAIATMCRGDATHVDGFLWPSVVGHAVGRVAARVGRNSLQEEFWREVDRRGLPRSDAAERFVLKLVDTVQVATSVFLHRLRIAGIPYAAFLGTQATPMRGSKAQAAETAGGFDALARVREGWEAMWTPATDVALVERIVLGDTLVQVCERTLARQLDGVTTTGAAADILMEAVVGGAPEAVSVALALCDELAAADDDLPSLARAARALSGLVSYGSSRKTAALGDDVLPELCRKTYDRAVLRVAEASTGDDDAIAPVIDALKTLHELAMGQPLVDRQAWIEAAHALMNSWIVHPTCSGLACGLLWLAQEIDNDELVAIVSQRLSLQSQPQTAAAFLEGFFAVNALALVKSRPVVEALDAFLAGIASDRLVDALPTLRRAFSPLGPTERRYLLEHVLAVRSITDKASKARAIVTETDKDKLAALDSELAAALDDLDDLL